MKAKVAVLFLAAGLLLACVSLGLAETMVGGHITTDTVWDKPGSPYTLTETLTIDKGVTLTIEPRVTVYWNNTLYSGYGIIVEGALMAKGTEAEWITFTIRPNTLAEGGMIVFKDSSDDQKCILEYCEVTYNCGIACKSASPTISWCKIDGSGGGVGIEIYGGPEIKPLITYTQIEGWFWGIAMFDCSPTIEYCLIRCHYSGGSITGSGGTPTIRFNDFYGKVKGSKAAPLDARQNFWSPEALEDIERYEAEYGNVVDYSDRLLTPGWEIDWTTGETT